MATFIPIILSAAKHFTILYKQLLKSEMTSLNSQVANFCSIMYSP